MTPQATFNCPDWPGCGCPAAISGVTAERLIADMAALNARCERGLRELSAIQCELAMIRRDLATLHGVPDGGQDD